MSSIIPSIPPAPGTTLISPETWKIIAQLSTACALLSSAYIAFCHFKSSRSFVSSPSSDLLTIKTKRPIIGSGKVLTGSDTPGGENRPNRSTSARVKALRVYPIKSCGGIAVESLFAGDLGPEIRTIDGIVRDRSWMVTTGAYHFLTQRRLPKMALIQPHIEGNLLVITAPGMPDLRVPIHPDVSCAKVISTEVWSNGISGIDCGDEAGAWMSQFLAIPGLRLVHHPLTFQGRQMREANTLTQLCWKETDKCAFADGAPYLLLSEESIQLLNTHLDKPAPWLHFRPNILVAGCPPNNEDIWERFRIGGAEFRNALLCARCRLTAVDPTTGTMSRPDVLEGMKRYRRNQSREWEKAVADSPLMAINLGIDKAEIISLGDLVTHL